MSNILVYSFLKKLKAKEVEPKNLDAMGGDGTL